MSSTTITWRPVDVVVEVFEDADDAGLVFVAAP